MSRISTAISDVSCKMCWKHVRRILGFGMVRIWSPGAPSHRKRAPACFPFSENPHARNLRMKLEAAKHAFAAQQSPIASPGVPGGKNMKKRLEATVFWARGE